MPAPLLHHTALTARFKGGSTPLGHHWELVDVDGETVGRTRRVYGGGVVGRTLRRSATVTGLASGTDQRAEVLDATGQVVVSLVAHNGREEYVTEIADAGGNALAVVRRAPKQGFRLQTPDGRELAALDYLREQHDPIELRDPAGTVIALMTRVPAVAAPMYTLTDELLDMGMSHEYARERQAAMHLGFTGSSTLSVQMDALPNAEPLRTLTVLLPVIAGHSY